jgi:hypothetical protein
VPFVPALSPESLKGFGIFKGKVTIADNFDAPPEEFADYQ